MFRRFYVLMDKAGEGAGGGGGSGGAGNKGGEGNVTLTKEQFDALNARIAKLEGSGKGGGAGEGEGEGDKDKDLIDKAKAAQADKDQKITDSKALESALRFSMGAKDWLKNHEALLPKNVSAIFEQADKESYDTAIEKDAALKSGIIQAFFSVQANVDLLTATQKSSLENFLSLTKNGKQEKAREFYDSVFEPTFEGLKRVKKATELNNGQKNQTDGEKALADRMMKLSQKNYLREKSNA